ncbi:unnamed protein product [Aphanomyces euteiches]|uniref:RxLR effector protein n=1 Tax=Aphanomyces euteiches TaxID=100861 RepID=A0A6G0WA42_9STRA|nr:hypothetical protein Ae201684_017153 [Aphanomyces euteiches]KAH9074085.1 hypothetical protein Ae201684P_015983 [Aphanomyces euteiches]KAH9149415.1 hypothetical protein AeRB84_007508 [Aphanomyces euteiches]
MRIFLSLVLAATAVLAFHQEQVNEPTVFEAPRALSAELKATASAQDETMRELTAAGRRRGRRGRRRRSLFGLGGRSRGRRGLVSVEEAQDEADETTRELTAAGRDIARRGRRDGLRERSNGARNA